MSVKITRAVGAVIYNPKIDSFFVAQRAKNKKAPLKWEFVGGKVEEGESLEQAVAREGLEEIGIPLVMAEVLAEITYDYGPKIGKFQVYFIKCQPFKIKPKPDPKVYKSCKWVKRKDLINLDWLEADKEFAKQLMTEIKYHSLGN